MAAAALGFGVPSSAAEEKDYSAAERALFTTPHLKGLKPPTTLAYTFRKAGSFEAGFEDRVTIDLAAQPDGACCAASGHFLTGQRQLVLPDLPAAEANPVILFFLERDVREMQRLTKGQQNHFRKRIRMAIFDGASIRPLNVNYRGRSIAAREIAVSPYLDDPNRPRFEQFATKQYRFVLSDAVPGGVYAIRTQVAGADGAAQPLLADELTLAGAEPLPPAAKP